MKLLKVTLEFEDKIKTLEGEEAEKWLSAINVACISLDIHGHPIPEFNWKIIKKCKCGKEAKEHIDNGLSCGDDMCDECFKDMVNKCREKSY